MTVAFLAARQHVAILIFLASFVIGALVSLLVNNPIPIIVMAPLGAIAMQSPRIAKQWEPAVVLRLGKFTGLRVTDLLFVAIGLAACYAPARRATEMDAREALRYE